MAEGNRLYNASAVKEFNGMSVPKREHWSSFGTAARSAAPGGRLH
jgi:hypothetical protein